MTVPRPRTGPLGGLAVVDLSRALAGPYAAMLLGDLGATVIKVERPGTGDETRQWGPPFAGTPVNRESTYFLAANRNKLSIELDLKSPHDLAVAKALITQADVLVENFRPGVMTRLGLGAEMLEQLNPRLVALSISGFGPDGPERDRPGYDQVLQAEGGLMSLTGASPDQPTKVGVPIADLLAALYGTIGVLSALQERERSGLGQAVSTSLLAGQIGVHAFQGTRFLVAGEVPAASGNDHPTIAPYGVFQAADRPLVIAVGNDDIWRRFAPLVRLDPDDPRFATNADRVRQRGTLRAAISEQLERGDAQHWLEAFTSAGIPAGSIRSLDEVYASEQVRSQGLISEVTHPALGRLRLPGTPVRFGRVLLPAPLSPPTLGQHNDLVRALAAPILGAANAPPPSGSFSPQAPEVLDAICSTFQEFGTDFRSADPLSWPGYREELAAAEAATGLPEAVVTGFAVIGGVECVVAVFDFRFLGGSMGEATGRKITQAFRMAVQTNRPIVTAAASGGARIQEGLQSLAQMQHLAAAAARARAAGIPHISIARDPTTGGVWASLAASADLLISTPGARCSFAGDRLRPPRSAADGHVSDAYLSDGKYRRGFIDALVTAEELPAMLGRALRLLAPAHRGAPCRVTPPPGLDEEPPKAGGWHAVSSARSSSRPRADAYLSRYLADTIEIVGDRAGGVDDTVRCGFGLLDGRTVAYAAQSGRTGAAGYRTITRLMQMAERFRLPALTLIDTPGAASGAEAEHNGIGTAIADLLLQVATMTVPVTSVVIGEGGSGGALALASPGDIWCTPGSYLAVIAPEAATAILKRPARDASVIADQLGLTPGDLVKAGHIRGIVPNSTPQTAEPVLRVHGTPAGQEEDRHDGKRPSGSLRLARGTGCL